jgi:hypothetical protein
MRILLLSLAISLSTIPGHADTYTGVVSDVKHFHNGGVAVDLDGKWPNQKMTFYVPPDEAAAVGTMPPDGAKVTATGTVEPYRGKPEIKIHKADQWKW